MSLENNPVAAAIFDFDGTLVDTMPLHYEAYRQTFASVGIELSPSDFYDNIGGTARETIPKFLRGRSCPLSTAEIHARKKQVIRPLFRSAPIAVLETAKLIDVLAGRMPLAIASSGSREGIETLIDRLGWRSCFRAVICGEDAAAGKPAPDLFLLAAQQLEVEPRHCIVFEDTDAGVAGALRAGMRVFDVRATVASSATQRT